MKPWRAAYSLTQLLEQVNTAHPRRSKASDGVIGDTAHAQSQSDHNPDLLGVVHALDLTNDPAHGLDSSALADELVRSRDSRISYVISDRRICSRTVSPWKWRPYAGADPHTSHVHLSVSIGPGADDRRLWQLVPGAAPTPHRPAGRPVLRDGSHGADVGFVQRFLGIPDDGVFGPQTAQAVIRYQRMRGLVPDGIVGPATWRALLS